MINTKMHKAVYGLAEKLMDADRKGHKDNFESLYAELQTRFVPTMKKRIKITLSNGRPWLTSRKILTLRWGCTKRHWAKPVT